MVPFLPRSRSGAGQTSVETSVYDGETVPIVGLPFLPISILPTLKVWISQPYFLNLSKELTKKIFYLDPTGVTGAVIMGAIGSGNTCTVLVVTGTGNGTIRFNVVDDISIVDVADNQLDGDFIQERLTPLLRIHHLVI